MLEVKDGPTIGNQSETVSLQRVHTILENKEIIVLGGRVDQVPPGTNKFLIG